jgi:hypothetical protein
MNVRPEGRKLVRVAIGLVLEILHLRGSIRDTDRPLADRGEAAQLSKSLSKLFEQVEKTLFCGN